MPTVIRDGKACGLIITSGVIPVMAEKGRLISRMCNGSVPFCPCREENLSPTLGERGMRKIMSTEVGSGPSKVSGITECTQASSPLSK